MIQRPPGVGAFEFVILSTLRAAQLMRGCTPRVTGTHKATVIAQCEVAEGKVAQAVDIDTGIDIDTVVDIGSQVAPPSDPPA